MTRTLAAAVAVGMLVAGCEPVGGVPAANPVAASGVATVPGGVSFGGSAEFGVAR
jgi:nitrous oxide reductase accessory protein NosL